MMLAKKKEDNVNTFRSLRDSIIKMMMMMMMMMMM